VEVVASTEYTVLTISAALDLALFLGQQERNAETTEIVNEYAQLAHRFGWHEWDDKITRIRDLLKADIPADA
jgi:hypothetical protein